MRNRLEGLHLRSTRPLGAAADLELYGLAILQRGIAVDLNFRVVDKEIFAAIVRLNESVAFFGVEPLDCSFAHILI